MGLDLKTYLDPAYHDAELRAFAFVSSQFRRGARNSIDCLLPFVIFAVAQQDGDTFDPDDIRQYVNSKYFISLPYYLIEDMRRALEQAGALEYDPVTQRHICRDASPQALSSQSDDDMSVDQIDKVSRQLSDYARVRGMPEPLSGVSWSEVLLHFFSPTVGEREYKKNAIRDRAIIASPIFVDNSVVADFISYHHDLGSDVYSIIEKIYYGVLVTDFLTKISASGRTDLQAGLEIVYDAPVLMRILGFCGRTLKQAATEMHQSLLELGCKTFYFAHSYNELLANVDYIITARKNGHPVKPETEEALRSGELTIADLATFKASPDAVLYNPNQITEHPASYEDRAGDEYQIDESEFRARLRGSGGWASTPQAAEADAASLALIMRLRKGKSPTDLWKSGTVFVTHNSGLASRVRRFLKEERLLHDRALNPFQTMSQVTTIAWLAKDIDFDPQLVDAKLIADCYSAAVPDEGWNQELLNKVADYDRDELQQMLSDALFSNSVREIASRQTFGNTAILRSTKTASVIRDAREEVERIKRDVHAEGVAVGRSNLQDEVLSRSIIAAKTISDKIGMILSLFCAFIFSLILLESMSQVDLPILEETQGWVVAIAGILTVWALLQLLGWTRTWSLKSMISRGVFPIIRRLQTTLGL